MLAETQPPVWDAEFRTDTVLRKSDSSFDPGQNEMVYLFQIDRAHLNLSGTLDETLKYRMRFSLNDSLAQRPDGSGAGLEYWYLEQKLSADFSWRFGKQFIYQGGWEGSLNSMDVYQYSLLGQHVRELYEVGLSGIYSLESLGLADHTIIAQILNQPGGGNAQQTSPALNIAWYGRFLEGFFDTILQLGLFPQDRICAVSPVACGSDWEALEPLNMLSLGTRFQVANFKINVDYLKGEFRGENVLQKGTRHKATSLVLFVQQGDRILAPLVPLLKWSYNTNTSTNAQPTDYRLLNELQLGVEYFPEGSAAFYRWHAVGIIQQITVFDESYSQYTLKGGISFRF
ncbi:MAG: hypothetical protein HQM12_10695 [SAR324 cluster bacterium]|nr:hypothetical protein [SAR324 cluster bacterium]